MLHFMAATQITRTDPYRTTPFCPHVCWWIFHIPSPSTLVKPAFLLNNSPIFRLLTSPDLCCCLMLSFLGPKHTQINVHALIAGGSWLNRVVQSRDTLKPIRGNITFIHRLRWFKYMLHPKWTIWQIIKIIQNHLKPSKRDIPNNSNEQQFKNANDFLRVITTNWYSIWHIFCHCIWHSGWHIFWHSIWYSFRQI